MRKATLQLAFSLIAIAALLIQSSSDALAQQTRVTKKTAAERRGEAVRERATVKYENFPREFAESLANVADTTARFYRDEFGLDVPERTIVKADINRKNRPTIWLSGTDEITLEYQRESELNSPINHGLYSVYALAYEQADGARQRIVGNGDWMTEGATRGLAYYLASEAIDRVSAVYNRALWPDSADMGGEGTRLMQQKLREGNLPDMVHAAGQWFELTKIAGKGAVGELLKSLHKTSAEKKPLANAIESLSAAKDSRIRPKLLKWFQKFEPDLLIANDKPRRRARVSSPPKLDSESQTLSYVGDRGKTIALPAGECAAVFFEMPPGEWYLAKIQFFGNRAADSARSSQQPTAWLCDEAMRPLASWPIGPGALGSTARWQSISTKATRLPVRFAVCIAPPAAANAASTLATSRPAGSASTGASGLMIGVDEGDRGHSALGTVGVSARPFDQGDWMIRAIVAADRKANPLVWRP